MNDLTPVEIAALQMCFHATIRRIVRRRAHHRCQCCGMEFMPGLDMARYERLARSGCPVMGTVYFVDGDKQNWRWENMLYLCQICVWSLREMSHIA